MMAFKVRFPLLLLLGVVFLALVCASASAISSSHRCEGWPERCEEEEAEEGRPRHKETGKRERARQEGEREEEEKRHQPPHHHSHEEEDEEGQKHYRPRHQREREDEDERKHHRQPPREQEEEEEEHQHHRRPQHGREREEDEEEDQKQRNPRQEEEDEDEDEEREHGAGHRRSHDQHGEREEEQRPRHRGRGTEEEEERHHRRHEERESERHRGGRQRRSRDSEEDDEEEESSSQDRKNNNPFLLRSNRFQTLLKNENGEIRLLQRFDKRSKLFENLQNYRLLEYRSKPNTLLLPQHYDADFILVVLRGKAILTVVNPKERKSFNLERGDAIKIPAGTLAYLANRDNEQDLRVVDLAIPVNRPAQFQPFFPSSSENQQSYFRGFSKDILEASFNTNIEEIERVLLEEQQQDEQRRGRKEQGQDEANNNPIVKVSRAQIEELSKNAKTSSKKKSDDESSKSEPFNLRSRDPIYSNNFGQFFQITPKQSPQLKDLDLYLTSVQINEGALLLPHYNSRGTVILVINEGKGNIELVGVRNEQQEEDEEDERSRQQVKRYRGGVSPGDVFIVPSSHPVAIKASSNSNLSFVGFGINAENNQRNFLAGEEDNVISQIHKQVKELAFPGSAQDVDELIKNQKQSHFANAQPKQKEGQKRSRGPLSSILGAFY